MPGSSASVTNSGSSTAATLDITIPRGNTGADGDLTWKGGWSSSTTYSTNEAVQYNGSSYIAIANNHNVTPTSADIGWTENGTATTWNIEWGATGFTPGSGTIISTTSKD